MCRCVLGKDWYLLLDLNIVGIVVVVVVGVFIGVFFDDSGVEFCCGLVIGFG